MKEKTFNGKSLMVGGMAALAADGGLTASYGRSQLAQRLAATGILALGIGGYTVIQADGCSGSQISACQSDCSNTVKGACAYVGCTPSGQPSGRYCTCDCSGTGS